MLLLQIHTLEKTLFTGRVDRVTLPGREGELTVHDNHMPLLTTLKKGLVTVRSARDGEPWRHEIAGGILEVKPRGRVTVLVTSGL